MILIRSAEVGLNQIFVFILKGEGGELFFRYVHHVLLRSFLKTHLRHSSQQTAVIYALNICKETERDRKRVAKSLISSSTF